MTSTSTSTSTEAAPLRPEIARRARHRTDVQGLRAVAVLAVLAYHCGLPLRGGFAGVDVFFVISGFVITQSLLGTTGTPAGSIARFYARRVRRLLPALALLISVVAVASTVLISPYGLQRTTAETGTHATLISANLYLSDAPSGYFDVAAEANPLLHTWSLSVEEQFYLVFPALLLVLLAMAARRPSGSRRTVLIGLGLLVLGSFALSDATSGAAGEGSEAFFSTVTRTWEFGVGALVAVSAVVLARVSRRAAGPLGVIGIGLLAIGFLFIDRSMPIPGVVMVVPVVGTALVIVAGMDASRGVTRLLGRRPVVWIGDVSYGLYLWHWPLIVFATAAWPGVAWVPVAAAVVSIGPTVLSYRYVENPVRRSTTVVGRRFALLVAVGILVPLLACAGLLRVSAAEAETDAVRTLAGVVGPSGLDWQNCATPLAQRSYEDCRIPVDEPRGEVVLVGDSNAGHFGVPVAHAANREGYDATMALWTGCPFVDLVRTGGGFVGEPCHEFVLSTLAYLAEHPPSLVVIGISSTQVIGTEATLTDPRTGESATTPEGKARLWESGLASVLEVLDRAGIPVLFVHTVPHFGDLADAWSLETCPAFRVFSDTCGTAIGRADVEAQQVLAREAEDRAVARFPSAASVDFTDDLCDADACYSDRSGVWLYRDAAHLSAIGAATLTDRFEREIVERARPADPTAG